MTKLPNTRFAVLPPRLAVPIQAELEARFRAFFIKMRANRFSGHRLIKLGYDQERKIKSLAERAWVRRMRESGLSTVKKTELLALEALAREGARLVGPSTEDEVYRFSAALHAESGWMREVSCWIMNEMLRHVATGGRGFALPPVILAGPLGIGKSHFARTIARILGSPVRMIDVGGGSAGFRISGTEKGWGSEQPGIPVETILATHVANPIMVVDEVDKAGTLYGIKGGSTSITTSLLQMLEPGTARSFECPFYRVPFDMSRVVWIMTANDVKTIPEPLRDRSRLFVLPKLTAADAVAHVERLADDPAGASDHERCREFITSLAGRTDGISLRQIAQMANAAKAPMPKMLH